MRLREAGHKLCGMVAAFSTVAGGVASELEECAAQDQLDEAGPLVEQLETMAQELMRAVDGLSLETLRRQAVGCGRLLNRLLPADPANADLLRRRNDAAAHLPPP